MAFFFTHPVCFTAVDIIVVIITAVDTMLVDIVAVDIKAFDFIAVDSVGVDIDADETVKVQLLTFFLFQKHGWSFTRQALQESAVASSSKLVMTRCVLY